MNMFDPARSATALGVLALVGLSNAANAQTFDFSYSGTGVTASGTFDTTPLPAAGKYLITGLNGTRNGAAMALIPGNADGSVTNYSPFFYDNVLTSPGTPSIDKYGLLFQSGGIVYNLYSGPLQEQGYNGGLLSPTDLTSFTVTPSTAAVPEPGSIALFVGMATVGAGVLRKRRK